METIDGLDLFWAEKGEGQCVLAVHGFSSCFYTWRALLEGLGDGFKVIAPDLPGFGCSGDSLHGDYSLEFYCRVLKTLAQLQGLGPLTVCGHSYGGLVCWMLAATYPGLVERMILIAPPVPGEKRCDDEKIDYLMLYAYSDLSVLEPRAFEVYRAANVRTPDPLKELEYFPNVQSFGTERKLPCLIMWGSEDRIVDPSHAAYWCRRNPGTSLHVYDGVGHCPHEESPNLFLARTRAFLLQEDDYSVFV